MSVSEKTKEDSVIVTDSGNAGPDSEIFTKQPSLKGRVTVVQSSFNPETEMVEPVDVLHRYVEFDQMTPEELSDTHEFLYGAKLCGCYDEHRKRMKDWTGATGFDFETKTIQ